MAEAFNKLLNCEEPGKLLKIDINTLIKSKPENINLPTAQEVETVLKELKNYKASREDKVFAEMWKYAGNSTRTSLTSLYQKFGRQKIWATGQL